VAIDDGPFRGVEAIYAGMSAHDRELVLINLLGRQTPVQISAGLIVPQLPLTRSFQISSVDVAVEGTRLIDSGRLQ
jgi:hypothetical protein